MSVNNIALLFFGLTGTYRFVRRSILMRNMDQLTDFAVALWLVVSFALVGILAADFDIMFCHSHHRWHSQRRLKSISPINAGRKRRYEDMDYE